MSDARFTVSYSTDPPPLTAVAKALSLLDTFYYLMLLSDPDVPMTPAQRDGALQSMLRVTLPPPFFPTTPPVGVPDGYILTLSSVSIGSTTFGVHTEEDTKKELDRIERLIREIDEKKKRGVVSPSDVNDMAEGRLKDYVGEERVTWRNLFTFAVLRLVADSDITEIVRADGRGTQQ